jgi:hypothetical protein
MEVPIYLEEGFEMRKVSSFQETRLFRVRVDTKDGEQRDEVTVFRRRYDSHSLQMKNKIMNFSRAFWSITLHMFEKEKGVFT